MCSFVNSLIGSKSKNVVKISSVITHRFPKDPYLRTLSQEQAQQGFWKCSINFESGLFLWKWSKLLYLTVYKLSTTFQAVLARFYSKYPHLIDKNGDGSSWIEHVSRGGLKIPSIELMDTVETMEIEFKKLHGDYLSKITCHEIFNWHFIALSVTKYTKRSITMFSTKKDFYSTK